MATKKPDKKEIISLAEKTKRYCDLLIEQSDNWLSEEEGVRNVEKRLDKSSINKKRIKKLLKNKGIKILIGILFSFSFSTLTLGQDVDSLFSVFSQSEGRSHVEMANQLADRIHALGHIDKINPLTEKETPHLIDAIIYGAMALYYSDRGNYVEAIFHNEKSLSLYRQINDSTRIIHKLQNLYVNYASTGQFDKALDCLKESLAIATIIGDQAMVANSLLCMGSLHTHNQNNESAIDCIKKGLVINRELENTRMIIWSLNALCNLYIDLDRIEEARDCIEESYLLCEQVDRISFKIDCWIAMALIHKKKREWGEAIERLNIALTASEEYAFSEFVSLCLLHLGDIYLESGISQAHAEKYLLRAVAENEKNNRSEDVMLAYDRLYTLHKPQNPVLALNYLEKSTELFKQLQKEETQHQLNNFHIQYQTAEKELEIERQQHVIKQQNLHRFILLSGFIVCFIILILLWYVLALRTKRNRVLAEMNATKDQFFSIISHDLKNPAIAQREALQMLIDYAKEWDTESLSTYYNELLKSADSQVELLYNLLNWAQVQTGRMPYSPTAFDLATELATDISLLNNMAKNKGVLLHIEIPVNTILTADRNMVATIVRNLLTNGVKFTHKGGLVSLYVEQTGKNHTFIIRDTGIGISSDQLHQMFQINRRQSQKGTSGEQGNGLGLIVCKELIEKHGGTLAVESVRGEGSIFRFTI
ncbi:tetratricopeptide repeat-containing sensor histidine kinase [Parabacteroides sp. PF5-9]|uniref:tetratricopeptide repeat-containing sensor histidine kinase n=1 Tax=Parabacteroides sp. PF5-9 TaxID=1742404 RepID=UPI002474D27B|nr:tetratricopeptide repeat-containing sensor histidine kinase [Parabacteroides sp. PF5-9]MDH6356993.1 signal transduction histidine kinase [Parabacteroides sp. PF5-9]